MADPVWGQLAKAQDDPTTIDTAVAAAIAAHNDDPTAHMDTGQSIDVHRKNDILDHPAGSVLLDKVSKRELRYLTNFDTLDAWFLHGDVALSDLFGVELSVEFGTTNLSYLVRSPVSPLPFMTTGTDYLFQSTIYVDAGSDPYQLVFGFGYNRSGTTLHSANGFGFKIVNGDLKASYSVLDSNTVTDIPDVDMSKPHVYSAQYSSAEGTITWFVDGDIVLTLSVNISSWNDDGYVTVDVQATMGGTGQVVVDCYDMLVSRSI